ncbi:Uncharacterised protein [Raoultella terrigena]|uniref:Uncharacterized protein n=1 Tax=Raoultella terrigena TaxID=577 RepID=A0A3P8M2K3_RAOTE|nr:Uncharacterised protein [Raoultella terrigena]
MAHIIDRQLRLLALAQNGPGVGIKDFPCFRRRDASLSANQQLLVQFTFQGRNLLTQRGLCDMQDFGCLSQTADIDDFTKYFSRLKFILPPVRNASTNAGS